jgi:hypothetical protein
VVASRDFVDRFGALQPFKAREELATLQAAIAEADACVREACVLKIEAMLIHAGKTKLKKTQRDLINAQVSEVASLDFLEDSMFQPALWKWANAHLS